MAKLKTLTLPNSEGSSTKYDLYPDWDKVESAPNIHPGVGTDSIEFGEVAIANGSNSIAGGVKKATLMGITVNADAPEANGDFSFAYGAGVTAHTAGTMVLGANSNAGAKGYYWWSIDFNTKTIQLSTKQKSLMNWSRDLPTTLTWAVNDVISIINGNKYAFCSKITAVDTSNMTITVDTLPFTESAYSSISGLILNPDDMEIIVPEKPNEGEVEFGWGAYAHGAYINAAGAFSTGFGYDNTTGGDFSLVAGRLNEVGYGSFAIGVENKAHAETTFASGKSNIVHGNNSSARGFTNEVYGHAAHAEGHRNRIGNVDDYNSITAGYGAHVEGKDNVVTGNFAHAEGQGNTASYPHQHVEGKYNVAGNYAHIIGNGTADTPSNAFTVDWSGNVEATGNISTTGNVVATKQVQATGSIIGQSSLLIGTAHNTETIGTTVLMTGKENVAAGNNSSARGFKAQAYGHASHAEGHTTITGSADYPDSRDFAVAAHAEGSETRAYGSYSHAEGQRVNAYGMRSHAEGYGTAPVLDDIDVTSADTVRAAWDTNPFAMAYGRVTHTEGEDTLAYADYGHAEGYHTNAGYIAHAEGWSTKAEGQGSHSEGRDTKTTGFYAHAEGLGTVANIEAQHVQGKYNQYEIIGENGETQPLNVAFAIGAGESDSNRWNIATIDWLGNAEFYGDVIANNISMSNINTRLTTIEENGVSGGGSGVGQAVEGYTGAEIFSDYENNSVSANNSTAFGTYNTISSEAVASFVTGRNNTVAGQATITAGGSNTNNGNNNTILGYGNKNYGHASFIEGHSNTLGGSTNNDTANCICTHIEGRNNTVIGNYTHVEGNGHKVNSANYCHIEGQGNISSYSNQHVEGRYNVDGDYLHIVGNGTSSSARSNAYTLDRDGNGVFSGSVKATKLILGTDSFGPTLPSEGVEGQVFFLVSE